MNTIFQSSTLICRRTPFYETVRFGRRVNVQKPREPHHERAKYLSLTRPMFAPQPLVDPVLSCEKSDELLVSSFKIKSPLEIIIAKEVMVHLKSSEMVLFLHANPVEGEDKFHAKVKLKKENFTLETFSKQTMQVALETTPFAALLSLFQSHTEIIFSKKVQLQKLKVLKKIPHLTLMAGLIQGRLLSVSQLAKLSQVENIESARSELLCNIYSLPFNLRNKLSAPQADLLQKLQMLSNSV